MNAEQFRQATQRLEAERERETMEYFESSSGHAFCEPHMPASARRISPVTFDTDSYGLLIRMEAGEVAEYEDEFGRPPCARCAGD
jgi:hypothetical protein